MSFQNFSELKELDDAKLSEEIVNAKKCLFDMRLKKLPVRHLNLMFLFILNEK